MTDTTEPITNIMTTDQRRPLEKIVDFVIEELFVALLKANPANQPPHNLGVRLNPELSLMLDELCEQYRQAMNPEAVTGPLDTFAFQHSPDTNSFMLTYTYMNHVESLKIMLDSSSQIDWEGLYETAVHLIEVSNTPASSIGLDELKAKMQGARLEFAFRR